MKKKRLISYCIILMLFCQISLCSAGSASAISEARRSAIISSCTTLQASLKTLQHSDSRARVYLGSRFETVISSYIKPLNHRLVENDIINIGLSESQTNFVNLKNTFSADFITYQQSLEDLIATDCVSDPEGFSSKLDLARERRRVVSVDVENLKFALRNHLNLINDLEDSL